MPSGRSRIDEYADGPRCRGRTGLHVAPPSSDCRRVMSARLSGEEGAAKKSLSPLGVYAIEPWQPRGGDSGKAAAREGADQL